MCPIELRNIENDFYEYTEAKLKLLGFECVQNLAER